MKELVDLVITTLEDPRWSVGDHEFPKDSGWNGQQFVGTFKPFCVVYMSGTTEITGSFGKPEGVQRKSVTVNMFGATREQLSAFIDELRPMMKQLNQTQAGPVFVQNAKQEIQGAIQRVDAWDKPLFLTTDRYTLFTTE